ncbi:MAG: biotin--[acetyl-CoA-carboxylase] ligase [Planctomycetaceae bacterium]|nr:biotin--[acetyl-CoA-carboxylase] ligase [Planctomycetaceae bacterium]
MTDDRPSQRVRSSPAPLPFVRTILQRPVVDSTNDLARSMLLQGLDELPFLIWADRQTLGRGRGENQWWSDEGSLTFTIALDPAAHSLRIDQEPRLGLMAAAAVIEAIGALGLTDPGIGIRWPNDIEVNGRKLGGVLPERVETRQGHRLLIGIGLNVLTRIDQAPPDVQRMATSLSALQLQPLEPSFLSDFLAAILTRFERALYRMVADDPGLAQQWDRLNLLRDQVVRVALGPRVISGKVHEIDAQGALGVHDGQQMHRLFGGQVLRNPSGDAQ